MYLYELAMELGERSADIADRAEALGLEGISPAAQITPEEAQTIRAAYGRGGPAADPAASPEAQVTGKAPRPPRNPKTTSRAILAFVVLAALGAFAFFFTQTGGDAERSEQIGAELEDWNEAPPPTVSPEVQAKAASIIPSNKPIDQKAMCAAQDVMYAEENRTAGSYDELRAQAANNGVWRKAADDLARFGPTDAKEVVKRYRDVVAKYDAVIAGANDAEIRDYLAGTPRYGLANRKQDVAAASDAMYLKIIPFCGQPAD
jgi:hypothetical protein